MRHRFLLDNDGSNFFYHVPDDIEGAVTEAVRECAPNVTTYLLCAGAGTYYYPTKVGEVVPNAPPLLAALERGFDPFGMFLRALRAAGKETFITYRMNDVHNPDAPDGWNIPRFKRDHPEFVVDLEAVNNRTGDWMAHCLDYSRPEVQQYILATIRELIEWYDVDGLQLDWLRFPRHLSGASEEVWAKREAITQFTAQVRELIRAAGKPVLLTARVPTSLAGCRYLGMDIAEWTRRGLVDFLVACPFLTTDFTVPLDELRAEMGEHLVPLYAGFDFGHGAQTHCPESLRAAATGLYNCRADGIYIFNFPCWQEHLAARPYHWLAGLDNRRSAAKKPLLFSVANTRWRVPQVDLPGELPVKLPAGDSAEVTLSLPKAALPAWRALVLVHSGGDVRLVVNSEPAAELSFARRPELFVEYVDRDSLAQGPPRKEECRVFQVDPAGLRAGANRLALVSAADAELEITRVNLGLW